MSRRFGGRPKGLERLGATRLIDRVAGALLAATGRIALVANVDEAHYWLDNVRVMRDKRPGIGGLAGIEAALVLGDDVVVVAWDMPFVTPELLSHLVSVAREEDADAVMPALTGLESVEPFCAFYSVRVAPALARFLDAGGGAARDFARSLKRLRTVTADSAPWLPLDLERQLFSVNTPEDLARARALAAETG